MALARHYREFEGLTIQQVADRLGRAPATVKAYFYDPTGEKARREGAGGQGPLRRGVSRLRCVHAAEEWKRGRLPVLQALPSRRDRALLDPRADA